VLNPSQLHEQSKNLGTFHCKLGEIGADFPDSLIKNLDRSIISMHPKYKRKSAKAKAALAKSSGNGIAILDEQRELQSRKFPGLSVPDQDWSPAEKYLADRATVEPADKLPPSISIDDTMVELAAVASRRNRPAAEDFLDGEPSNKRHRNSEYGRHEQMDGYGARDGQGAREGFRDNGYSDRGRSRPVIDERPVLYKIYNGVVQNLRDFGAFVSLDGVQGRAEGERQYAVSLIVRYGTCLECHYRPNTKSLRGAQTQRPSKSQGYVDRCEQVWPEHERRRSENRRRFVVRDIGMNVLSSDPIYMYKPPRRSLRRSEEQLLELHQEAIPCLFCMSTRGKGPVRNACRAPNASRSSN